MDFQTQNIPIPSTMGISTSFFQNPTDLEIGSGVGWHAITRALKNPKQQLIAIEHSQSRFESFQKRVSHHPTLPQLLPVHANAVHWITHYVPERSLQNIFILFPNPYPKAKQSNKRWHNMPFMDFLLDRLVENGKLILATNEQFYFQEAYTHLEKHPKIKHVERIEYSVKNPAPWSARTHFEKKYLNRGQTCYQLSCMRRPYG